MKRTLLNIILIYIFRLTYGCEQDWHTTCKTDEDCCSGVCKKEAEWQYGVCSPKGINYPPEFNKCADDFDKHCVVHEHCCSGLCDKSPDQQFGICIPDECKPLVSKKLEIICFTPSNELTPCDKPLKINSRAVFGCNHPYYVQIKKQEYTQISCRNGQWDRPLVDDFCEADCGRAILPEASATANGKLPESSEFPWHAGIYELDPDTNEYKQICGGVLISQKVIISAAHCFTVHDGKEQEIHMKDFSLFKVAVGKNFRNINASEDKLAQIKDVASIEISQKYHGRWSQYTGDIAFVVLKEEVEYSSAVMPVCIDSGEENSGKDQLVAGAIGKVVGWKLTNEQEPSERLNSTDMPLVSIDKCREKIADQCFYYVSEDKLCLGDEKFQFSNFMDSGGGSLIFADPTNEKYYLHGIVSLRPECNGGKNFALFTKLSSYKLLTEKYLQDSQKECEPLSSKKLEIKCITPSNKKTSCDRPLKTNSRAIFRCKTSFFTKSKEPEYSLVTCQNGQWDRPVVDDFCEADCGKSAFNGTQSAIINGKVSDIREFPWHAGFYGLRPSSGKYELIGGGTLISPKVVISAAHILVTENYVDRIIKLISLPSLKIAVGKYYGDYYTKADEPYAQIRDVASVEISPNFNGIQTNYKYDIAIVVLKEQVEYSLAVVPICLDIGKNNFEKDQLRKGARGQVVGWGQRGDGLLSEKLKLVEMLYVPTDECVETIRRNYLPFLNEDKFCAGNEKSQANVCKGDSGGGLVFVDPTNNKYYLRGIVSIGAFKKCSDGEGFALLTAVSSHKELVEKYILDAHDECDPIASEKLEITCFTPSNQITSCDKPLKTNSRAIFRCNTPIYWRIGKPKYTRITCRNGKWDRPLVDDFCEIDCGRSVSDVAVSGGTKGAIAEVIREFPWHAGIYELDHKTGKYEQTCGGTLISPKVVISAARCFVKENAKQRKIDMKELRTFKIAVGTYYRNISETEDALAQIKEVVGWGRSQDRLPSEKLNSTEIQFVPTDECREKIGNKWSYYVSEDKLCAKDDKNQSNIFWGDIGGGLVFADPTKEKHYLRGIVSLRPHRDAGGGFSLFTKISSNKELVERYSLDDPPTPSDDQLGSCRADWVECSTNKECCSVLCEKDKNSTNGLCKPNECQPIIMSKLKRFCFTPSNKTTSCDKLQCSRHRPTLDVYKY